MKRGAQHCPECGSKMSIKDTNHGGERTFRIAECPCGERWETTEQRSHRLPPATANAHTQPGMAVRSRGQPPMAASPPESSGGFGGDLPAIQDGTHDSNPISPGNPKRGRARSNEEAIDYPKDFIELWVNTGRRGVKFLGLKAWMARGRPTWREVEPVWRAYLLSERPVAGYIKDLSSWLNGRGHQQEWLPAKATPIRRTDPAIRAREEAEDAALERRAELAFGRTV